MGTTIRLIVVGTCITLGLAVAFVGRSGPVLARSADVAQPASAGLYLLAPGKHAALRPIDPTTLANLAGGRPIALGRASSKYVFAVYPSRGGSAALVVSNGKARIVDLYSGAVRAHFQPRVGEVVAGISADASRVVMYSGSADGLNTHTEVVWRTVSATTGRTLGHFHVNVDPLLDYYDPAMNRVYVVDIPGDPPHEGVGVTGTTAAAFGPRTPTLKAYDLPSGRLAGAVRLNGLLVGSWGSDCPAIGNANWPGVAISPDGRQVAVLDAVTRTLAVVDTQTMTIAREERLTDPTAPDAPAITAANFPKDSRDSVPYMQFSPDGRTLYFTSYDWMNGKDADGNLHAIDVASGNVSTPAAAGGEITGIYPSADGSAVYALTQARVPGKGANPWCPCALQRFDAHTLQLTATRTLSRPVELYQLGGPTDSSGT